MKKWMLFLISLLSASNLMCLVGARDYDQDHFFTKLAPRKEQLAGKYLPTTETTSLIKDEGQYQLKDVSIYLYPDGNFEVQNMPDWWIPNDAGYGKSNGGVDSGTGKWTISYSNISELWQITLDFRAGVFNSRKDLDNDLTVELNLGGQQPPYSIWIYVGDPDLGDVMVFEQVVGNP